MLTFKLFIITVLTIVYSNHKNQLFTFELISPNDSELISKLILNMPTYVQF